MTKIDRTTATLLARLGPDAVALLLDSGEVAVSPAVAASITGRSIFALRQSVDEGALPAFGKVHRRVNLADLAAWHGRDAYDAAELHGAFRRISQRSTEEPSPPVFGDDGRRDQTPD